MAEGVESQPDDSAAGTRGRAGHPRWRGTRGKAGQETQRGFFFKIYIFFMQTIFKSLY